MLLKFIFYNFLTFCWLFKRKPFNLRRSLTTLNNVLLKKFYDNMKNVFDFSQQLHNDLISLLYYGFERNLGAAGKSRKELVDYIRENLKFES